jgi:hypothetical protein
VISENTGSIAVAHDNRRWRLVISTLRLSSSHKRGHSSAVSG